MEAGDWGLVIRDWGIAAALRLCASALRRGLEDRGGLAD
jgi:hypothetical protein